MTITSSSPAATTSSVVARTLEIVPELRERSEQAALERRLPVEQHGGRQARWIAEGAPGHPQWRTRARCPRPPRCDLETR